ncbi:MAG TPA: hypothetical protein VK492_09430 [Chitinophagaceae bacterium]|nr:hypothetical protein [Chitinophagaceae bacterium]
MNTEQFPRYIDEDHCITDVGAFVRYTFKGDGSFIFYPKTNLFSRDAKLAEKLVKKPTSTSISKEEFETKYSENAIWIPDFKKLSWPYLYWSADYRYAFHYYMRESIQEIYCITDGGSYLKYSKNEGESICFNPQKKIVITDLRFITRVYGDVYGDPLTIEEFDAKYAENAGWIEEALAKGE